MNSIRHRDFTSSNHRATSIAPILTIVLLFTLIATRSAQAQTLSVLHNFTAGGDGYSPTAGLTIDTVGNLYGASGPYVVFRLSHKGSGWILNPLHTFTDVPGGSFPTGPPIFGPDGNLYGATLLGGLPNCFDGTTCGTVFNLQPPPGACKTALCPWTETVLYRFTALPPDGFFPVGNPVFDQAGNLYGTTLYSEGWGIVYQLKPSNGGWAESVVYGFTGHEDGATPMSGPILDRVGNLYGTTSMGGNFVCDGGHGCGTVYELTPSGPGWTEHTLYTFHHGSDGSSPYGGVIFDGSGNLYGTTTTGGFNGGGTVFELTPSNGSWTFHVRHSFAGGVNDVRPTGSLAIDSTGNLYGLSLSRLWCKSGFVSKNN